MPRHLLLFTDAFPYGGQEAFLETELPYLADGFELVTIQPIRGGAQIREVPSNVSVARPLFPHGESRRRRYAELLLRPRTWELFARESAAAARTRRAHPATFHRILFWAVHRAELESCAAVEAAVARSADTVAYSYWGHLDASALPKLAAAGVPCFVRYHRCDLYEYAMDASASFVERHARYFPWRDEVMRAATNVFISEHGLRYFRAKWARGTDVRLELHRLGVKARAPNPPAAPGAPLTLVSCSNLLPVKRVDRIAALAKALAAERRVTWHHFGGGGADDLARVRAELADAPAGLDAKLWGPVTNAELMAFYAANHVDVFVNLSLSEGIPVAIMEALSAGIPVVATAVDGTPEAVVDGESGLLVDADAPDHPRALATTVSAALAPGGALASARPLELWRRRFDASVNYRRLVEALQNRPRAAPQPELPRLA